MGPWGQRWARGCGVCVGATPAGKEANPAGAVLFADLATPSLAIRPASFQHCRLSLAELPLMRPPFSFILRRSLLEYVRDKKKLPEEESVLVLQQLLHALQFCHRKDVS